MWRAQPSPCLASRQVSLTVQLLKIRVRDMAGFNQLHGRERNTQPGVRQIRTIFVLKEVKDNAPLSF